MSTTQEFTFEPRAVYTGEVKAFLQFKLTEKSEADFTGDTFQDPAYSLGAETAGHSTATNRGPGQVRMYWRYLSASHRPSVWATVAAGHVRALFIAEDPPGDGAGARAPIEPSDRIGATLNLGQPSDAILARLLSTRAGALARWKRTLISRGWITAPPTRDLRRDGGARERPVRPSRAPLGDAGDRGGGRAERGGGLFDTVASGRRSVGRTITNA